MFIHQRPKVVHLQSKDDFIAGTLAGRLYGARVVWSDYADLKHVWRNMTVWYKNPTGRLVYWCARLAHAITVVSESEKKLTADNLSPRSSIRGKLVVVHIGVVDREIKAAERSADEVIFCAASRIVTDKGVGELVAAFNQLQASDPHLKLWILGDGPERDKFDTGHPGITFFGHFSDPLSMIKAADVFLLPTYHEGFSVALVEASMLGKAIIATEVGGNVEIIHDGQTGLLVKVKDTQSLAAAMKKLASDKKLREKLGTHARQQYLNQFQFSTMIRKGLLPLYEGTS